MERDGGSRDEDDEGLFHSLKLALCDYRVCPSSLLAEVVFQPKKKNLAVGVTCADGVL